MYLRRPKFVVVLFTPHQKFGERKKRIMMMQVWYYSFQYD